MQSMDDSPVRQIICILLSGKWCQGFCNLDRFVLISQCLRANERVKMEHVVTKLMRN